MERFQTELYVQLKKSKYLPKLYSKLIDIYGKSIFHCRSASTFTDKELANLLRFADLLSKNVNDDDSIQLAQEIISMLYDLYPSNELVCLFGRKVYSSLCNYPGKNLINFNDVQSNMDILVENIQKKNLTVPFEEDMYFLPLQKEIFDNMGFGSFSYSGPTSMGKSLLIKTFIKQNILKSGCGNFAILVPSKALIAENVNDLYDALGDSLAAKDYVIVTSANAAALDEKHNFIFVMTPERYLYLINSYKEIETKYLFIDEAHRISLNDARSPFYHKIFTTLSTKTNKPSVVFASPNIDNPSIYNSIVEYPVQHASKSFKYSPVAKFQFFINMSSQGKKEAKIYSSIEKKFVNLVDIGKFNNEFDLITHYGLMTGNNLIYCNGRDRTIQSAYDYGHQLPDLGIKELDELSDEISTQIHSCYYLAEIIKKGVAYHIGYLPPFIRYQIEKLFKKRIIKVLFCTSTLIEGINLPADNLFVISYKRGQDVMTSTEYKNLIGRAGRLNYSLFGRVFVIKTNNQISETTLKSLISSQPDHKQLAIKTSLSDRQKQGIITSLENGDYSLARVPHTNEENYSMLRKYSQMLSSDYSSGRDTMLTKEFDSFVNPTSKGQIVSNIKHSNVLIDEDLSVTIDQIQSLRSSQVLQNGYPKTINYDSIYNFLSELSRVYNWPLYDSDTIGRGNSLKYYSVLLNQWMNGFGFPNIINEAINWKIRNLQNGNSNGAMVKINGNFEIYDYSQRHNNAIVGEVMETIENIFLFKISNYFLRFSNEYKEKYGIQGRMNNDWYEFVEFGTSSELSIFLQRNGFSRETADFIRQQRRNYVVHDISGYKIKKSILNTQRQSVKDDVERIIKNVPGIFVE